MRFSCRGSRVGCDPLDPSHATRVPLQRFFDPRTRHAYHYRKLRTVDSILDVERGALDVAPMACTQQILGIRFFDGDVDEALAFMFRHGGLLVAPSGTCFVRLRRDAAYREAVTHADLAIA